MARDIQSENIQEIANILTEWLKSCENCSACLQEQIENANAEKAKRIKHKERLEEQVRFIDINHAPQFLTVLCFKLTEVKRNIKKQSTSSQQNFDDREDGEFLMGEKNLNMKKARPKHAGTSKGAWFKNFN